MEIDKIYNIDCLEGMKHIPDGSIDAIICDEEQLKHIEEIIGDGYKVYGRDVERQSLLFDGELYLDDILEAADYIKSLTQKQ